MAVTTLVSFLLPSIGLDQVSWNELDLPDFTTIERVYLLCAKGRRSGSGVKEKQNSSFDDPVMNIDCVNKRIGSPSTMNVNVESGLGPTSYAKLDTGEPSRKSMKFRTLITPVGNRTDVAIPLSQVALLVNGLLI
ncbi:hypothetical protein Tco_0226286 [Tanacetum coccineum]